MGGWKYATPGEGPGPRPPAGPGVPLWLSSVGLATITLPGARASSPDLSALED